MSQQSINKARSARDSMLQEAAERLNEHFDSIRIFATLHVGETNATEAYSASAGNRFASELQIREWVEMLNERTTEDIEDDDE